MPRPVIPFILLAAGAGVCLLSGCGSKPVADVPVWGTVRHAGGIVRTGTVVFTPMVERGYKGPLAWSEIGPNGGYRLVTGGQLGVKPGWYRITVMAVEMPAGMPEGSMPRMLLPARYSDPALSGLSCEIHAERDNQIDLNLE